MKKLLGLLSVGIIVIGLGGCGVSNSATSGSSSKDSKIETPDRVLGNQDPIELKLDHTELHMANGNEFVHVTGETDSNATVKVRVNTTTGSVWGKEVTDNTGKFDIKVRGEGTYQVVASNGNKSKAKEIEIINDNAESESSSYAASSAAESSSQAAAASSASAEYAASESSSQAKAKSESESEAAEANASTEDQSALAKAEDYATTMDMSKQGVYEQLTSDAGEQFSPEAGQYAIDHLTDIDWNANALAKAKDYQSEMDMSPAEIRDQLTSSSGEQFTQSEADYAIQHLND